MGLVTPFAGGSETRPACNDAGLPGAGCPGSACRRYHEARDRTEPTPKGFGESRGRAPRGERVSQKERAPRGTLQSGQFCLLAGPRYLPPRLSALRLPFGVWRHFFSCRAHSSGVKKRAARTENFASPLPACGERSLARSAAGEGASPRFGAFKMRLLRVRTSAMLKLLARPPHPDLLPARGEKEQTRSERENEVGAGRRAINAYAPARSHHGIAWRRRDRVLMFRPPPGRACLIHLFAT